MVDLLLEDGSKGSSAPAETVMPVLVLSVAASPLAVATLSV